MYNYIAQGYEKIHQFNDIAGNLTNVEMEDIDNQASLIFEELSETITGIEEGDRVAILDGAIDMFVVVSGFMQKLEAQGYDIKRALARVTDNNMEKYPKTLQDADYTVAREQKWTVTFNEKYGRFVLKDLNGKIRKHLAFSSVVLTDLLPKKGV